jgi:LmbE family N-acetylglucosaminyl deacetylase
VQRPLAIAAACLSLLSSLPQSSRAADAVPSSTILRDLHNFEVTGRVLYVAAHPDDENTELIAYLAGGRHYRTAYLSLTRGDGGQNVLGPEFGDELGVIRTQELLAARRIDGGRQFFTRAIDFGFSKNPQETLRIWNRQEVLSDVVRVIREFRPDVVITRFSPTLGHTHGHHTASAILALEAFKLAGDPKAFPDQLKRMAPWQPKRILWNIGWFRPNAGAHAKIIRINDGGEDPATGESFADIAADSRSMHKTQGFGMFRPGHGGGPRWESFVLLAGAPAQKDILDDVNTTWSRFSGGAVIGQMADKAIADFNKSDPAASVPALLKIKSRLATLEPGPILAEKSRLLDHIIQECLGLKVTTTLPQAEVLAGETLRLRHKATLRSNVAPVRWVAARYPTLGAELKIDAELSPGEPISRDASEVLPANTPLTQPYWLEEDHGVGMFKVGNPDLIGRPENPPVLPIQEVFEVGNQVLILPDQPVQLGGSSAERSPRTLTVISPVSLKFPSATALFAPGATRQVKVRVTAARSNLSGTVHLSAPEDWQVSPAESSFDLGEAGAGKDFTFSVTAPGEATTARITAHAIIDGKDYDNERVVIDYPHIPLQVLQPPARLKGVCLHLAIRGQRVGYLPGAGDNVADALKAMGYSVTTLSGADLTSERLKQFDAVVIGVRAFNVRNDLAPHVDALFDYVKNGGNLIEQYNRPRGLKTERLTPFELHLSSERVTDETAPVTFLAPDNPVLNTPNKITEADFDGWIQERGIYYPDRWDDHFTPVLSCHDAGEEPLKGGLLVADYGKGHVVYTGLVFFRQLPAGVPGAYRLFANLVSLGK